MKKQSLQGSKRKNRAQRPRDRYTSELPLRAESVNRGLAIVDQVFRRLLSDENFVTLLQAEGVRYIPQCLKHLMNEGKNEHEIV
jgi:hypothetical protein